MTTLTLVVGVSSCRGVPGAEEFPAPGPSDPIVVPAESAAPESSEQPRPAAASHSVSSTGCPEGMVLLPGGRFEVGTENPNERWHEPLRVADVSSFCMDIWEYPNTRGNYPLVNVSWTVADQLCRSEGKRLCTGDEWERACRGSDRRTYAYGNVRDPERCNTPLPFEGPRKGQHLPLARAGDHERCATPEGVQDLNGNISEWVSDIWVLEEDGLPPREEYFVRGGTMWRQTFYGQDCTSKHHHPPENHGSDDGFRCCLTPEPG